MYVMDYGAPVGYRLALKHPERVTALIVQNGNAYDRGAEGVLGSDKGILGRWLAREPRGAKISRWRQRRQSSSTATG